MSLNVAVSRDAFHYRALIIGAVRGPNAWSREVELWASDIKDAAEKAMSRAEDMRGWVISISQIN